MLGAKKGYLVSCRGRLRNTRRNGDRGDFERDGK